MKFEKHVKEKFDNRSIQPSQGAWDRVADQLQQEGQKNKARIWPKIAIAAGFIGILIISATFLFPTENSIALPIVDVQHDPKLGNDQMKIVSKEDSKPKTKIDFVSVEAEKQVKKTQKRLKNPKNELVVMEVLTSSKGRIKVQDTASQVHADRIKNLTPAVEQSIDLEVNRLLAAVQTAEQQGEQVSDYTIDSLLAQAREKIFNNRVYEEQTENLSATALLQSVENELDQSFRERVFDALRDGFTKAREAIVSRNE